MPSTRKALQRVEYAYIEWLASRDKLPSMAQRKTMFESLCKRNVSTDAVRGFEAREDVQAYITELSKGTLEEARAKFHSRFAHYVDMHETAVQKLFEQKEWAKVVDAVQPVLERISPKRGTSTADVRIAIVMTPERLAGFQPDYTEAIVEALPAALPDATGSP